MRRIFMILSTLCLGLIMSAQEGVIRTRPANAPSGRLLTMEETTLSRELSPKNLWCSWNDDRTILLYKYNKWLLFDIKDGSYSDYKAPDSKLHGFAVPNVKGEGALREGNSLYFSDSEGNLKPIAISDDPEISYGQHVSRNEFGIEGGIFWSPDGNRLAFYRRDESKVSSFPLLDITTRTGSLK